MPTVNRLVPNITAALSGVLTCDVYLASADVRVAGDGESAVAAMEKSLPDLVLSDVMMPRLDGLGLLARLRSNPRTSTLPIILLSARAGEESRVEGLQTGADDYLIKPFTARELLARVASNLETARIRRNATKAGGGERGAAVRCPAAASDQGSS